MTIPIGKQFARLTVIEDAGRGKHGEILVLAQCSCGTQKKLLLGALRRGNTKSCGCFRIEAGRQFATKHGLYGTPTHVVYWAMVRRCTNRNNDNYKYYGGRGIKVCDRWMASLEAFVEDMGSRPGMEYSIDRIDPDGNYEPGNCRWLKKSLQSRTTRRAPFVEYEGADVSLADLYDRAPRPASYNIVRNRIRQHGWPVQLALDTPSLGIGKHRDSLGVERS